MSSKKSITINIIIAILIFLLQYNDIIPLKIYGAVPFLPFGFALVISMFLSETGAVFCGLLFGILSDTASSALFGFNSIVFTVMCLFVSIAVKYIFNNNIRACLVLEALFTILYFFIRWLVFYTNGSDNESFTYLFKIGVPSAIYTAIVSAVLYLIERRLHNEVM